MMDLPGFTVNGRLPVVQLNGIQIHLCRFFIIVSVVALKEKGEITLLLTIRWFRQNTGTGI
jgi:hypothetical protein